MVRKRAGFDRRRKVNPDGEGVVVDFIDKNKDAWEKYRIIHPHLETWMSVNGHDVEALRKLAEESKKDSKKHEELVRTVEELKQKSPYNLATANDVNWVAKIKMQGAIQKWVDHSISSTTNVPEETSEELVDKLYQTAWESGCKGVTIYRAGSRDGVLIEAKAKEGERVVSYAELEKLVSQRLAMERPENVVGRT